METWIKSISKKRDARQSGVLQSITQVLVKTQKVGPFLCPKSKSMLQYFQLDI